MLDQQRKNAIDSALKSTSCVFRGIGNPGDSRELMMAMLLLKYISDIGQDRFVPSSMQPPGMQFVVPAEAGFRALLATKFEPGNGQRIDKALRVIEKINPNLRGIFQGISFDATALGNAEQKDRVLSELLSTFNDDALEFSTYQEDAAQAVAYAADSLIRYIAANSKRGGEFLTPPEISQLIAHLMQPEVEDTVGDPCCGSGSLLIACSEVARQKSGASNGCVLYGQEKNGSTLALAKMNMILHGENQYQLEWGDTLRDPKLFADDGHLRKYDIVVSTPPFSLRDWGHEVAEHDIHQRYQRGVPPRTVGDYAFLSHMVETLNSKKGRMAAVVSLGVLFRGGAERQIREQLIKENLIHAVIALPPKMFLHTAIPVVILVLCKNRNDDNVLFIDASRSYQHGKIQNVLRQADLDQIIGSYRARDESEGYARKVTQNEIIANDYNLSVTRYVESTEDEAEIDLAALRAERALLRTELAVLETKLASLLEETGYA